MHKAGCETEFARHGYYIPWDEHNDTSSHYRDGSGLHQVAAQGYRMEVARVPNTERGLGRGGPTPTGH